METITAAAFSTRNLIGSPAESIQVMATWLE